MDIPIQNMIIYNSWPEVSVNRNDSEIKMFTKYFSTVKKREILRFMTNNFDENEPKSKAVANIHRDKGNTFYKILEYPQALQMYNISISRAPRDSTEFALAIGNRSAVLFDMKKYKECLKDVEVVLRSEYPKNLFYKVFLRQSKCYFELNLISEAKNSLERAQESFNKEKKSMGQAQIAVVEDSIKTLNNEIKERKEKPSNSGEINNNEEPSLTLRDGENTKFLNASKAVNMKNNTASQRSVVAASYIKKGDVLFIEKPYAATAINQFHAESRFTICSFCFQFSLNCIPCSTCTANFYCSSECQVAAWNLSHKWECFNDRRKIISDLTQKIGLSVLFKASQDGFKTEIEDNSVYGNKDNNYAFMNQLLTHKNKVPEIILNYNIKSAVWMVMYLKNFTDYFDWLYVQTNRPEGSKEDLYNIVGGYIVKFLLQLIINVDTIQDGRVVRDDKKCLALHCIGIGLGVYLSTALLNHSCVPNAIQSFHGSVKIVKALKNIKQGTEITVNYLGGNDKSVAERHSELEKYLFKCTCVACTTPDYEELREPYLCPRCRGKAYPIKGRNKFAKCIDCSLTFNKRETHKRNENRIAEMLMVFQITGHFVHKDNLYTMLKKTYHKDHLIYIIFYNFCLEVHEKNGEYKNNIDVIKSLTETTANIFGDTSKQYLTTLMECTYNLVEYSNILKKQNSDLHETFVNEAKEYMKKSVECLHYYVNPRNVNVFVEKITDYLNTGKITNDKFEDDDDDDHCCIFKRFVDMCSLFR